MANITRNEIRKLCRICLKIQPHMRFLSSSELIDGNLCTLSQMLKSCTCIQVSSQDELPNMICQSCINRLYVSWEFKVDCEKSEAKLHEILNSNGNMKEMEENINLATSTCDIVMANATSQNNIKNIQVLKVISVKNLKNNLKVVKGNVGESTKKVIVENLDQILKENNVKLHDNINNNNNNVSQNTSNHNNNNNNLTNKQNQRTCIDNGNLQLENSKRKVIILENPPVVFAYDENESPKNDVQYYEEIENISETSAPCEYRNNIKQEFFSLNSSTLESETIDLTLSDCEDIDNVSNEKSNSKESNVENNSETDTINTPPPDTKQTNVIIKKKILVKEINANNQCIYCQNKFPTKIGLHLHMKSHVDAESHCCLICDKTFSLFSNLEMHLKTHIGNNSLKCPKCPKYFSSTIMLKQHEKLHDEQFIDCELCCKKFSTQTGLKRHLKLAHSGINQYFCDVCMKGFTLKIMLKHHRKIHIEDHSYKCNKCQESFLTFDELTEHNDTHAPVMPFKCDKCDETFATDAALKQHRMLHVDIQLCKLCSTEFQSKSALKQHMQEHKKMQSLTCKICETVLDSRLELRNHIKTHFMCDLCSNSFENIRLLTIHRKKHFDSSSLTKKSN